MGARNHEYRHDAFDHERRVLSGERPADGRDHGSDDRDDRQKKCRAVRKRLRPGS